MSFLKPTSTFTRYRIDSEFPDDIWAQIPDLLRQFQFHSIDTIPESSSSGWTTFDSPYDTEWKDETPYLADRYVCFGMRRDVRRIPYEVLTKEVHQAIEQEKVKNADLGKNFISRDRKNEIREQVKLGLLNRIPPSPTYCQVIWNWGKDEVWVSTNQATLLEIFEDLFARTFGISLLVLDPYGMCDRLPQLCEMCESSVIGSDFLLWWWHRSDQGHRLVDDQGQLCSYEVADSISLWNEQGYLSSTGVDAALEGKIGVVSGKSVSSLRIKIYRDPEVYVFTLRASDMSFSSVKAPRVESTPASDRDGMILEKIYLLEKMIAFVTKSFEEFVQVRMDEKIWASLWKDFRIWSKTTLSLVGDIIN